MSLFIHNMYDLPSGRKTNPFDPDISYCQFASAAHGQFMELEGECRIEMENETENQVSRNCAGADDKEDDIENTGGQDCKDTSATNICQLCQNEHKSKNVNDDLMETICPFSEGLFFSQRAVEAKWATLTCGHKFHVTCIIDRHDIGQYAMGLCPVKACNAKIPTLVMLMIQECTHLRKCFSEIYNIYISLVDEHSACIGNMQGKEPSVGG